MECIQTLIEKPICAGNNLLGRRYENRMWPSGGSWSNSKYYWYIHTMSDSIWTEMGTWPPGGLRLPREQARPSYTMKSLKTTKAHSTLIQGVTAFDFTFSKDHLGENTETNDVMDDFQSTKMAQNCMFLGRSIDIQWKQNETKHSMQK